MKKTEVFLIENGEIKKRKVLDFGDFLALKLYNDGDAKTYYAWAKGKPLLLKTSMFSRPKYTYIVCPELATTLTTTDIVKAIQRNKLRQSNHDVIDLKASKKDEDVKNDCGEDTFNPSTQIHDKSVAKWFGNIVRNREDEALKNVVTANKMSKWVFVMLLLFGIMLGLLLPSFFTAFSGSATTTPIPTYKP